MRVGVIGCGGIASVHGEVLRRLPGCEPVGFADCKPERAREYAARYGGRAYGSMEALLEAERPDVIHICTPHFLHVPMAVYGLSHGVHVFMEKPPAMSGEQVKELAEAVEGSDRRLGICFQNRYNPCVQAALALLRSQKAGKLLGARGLVTWHREAPYYTQSDWRGRLATEGGGVLINQSVHTLDLLAYFLGKPLWVDARMSNHHLPGIIEVEDTMEALIRFEEGTACFYATTAYCSDEPPLIELACEKMKIRIEDPEVFCIYPDGRKEALEAEKIAPLGKGYWGSGHGACIADFYRALENNEPFPLDWNHVKDTTALLLATYASAREGAAREVGVL